MASSSTPHKGRRKQKLAATGTTHDHAVTVDSKTNNPGPSFPLASFFWPARKNTSQWVIIPLVLTIVGLFRWCVGLWGYSGFHVGPMYGDYEAQRHWIEITTHLPMTQWYFHDLEYWGLDYPPLTAYHSWVLGKIGSLLNPSWFALYSSRGKEEQLLKVFMRATVIFSEYLTYVPSIVFLNRQLSKLGSVNNWESSIALVAILMQPATILIDHAHFQYNTVMLGFAAFSIYSLTIESYAFACVFFVAALSFKQMALYYAPAVFFYLLGSCLNPNRPLRFVTVAIATLASFAIILAPLLLGTAYDTYRNMQPPLSLSDRTANPVVSTLHSYIDPGAAYYPYILQLTQVAYRIFPFARGIFEDKVANLWGCIHLLHKLHGYPTALLQRISLFATFFAIEPACMLISLSPARSLLPWALASCAWGFFLCSFQVHEKSVLLPLLPMTILLGGKDGLSVEMRAWIGWANMLAAWTLFPLLKRDELRIPYFVLTLLWSYLLGLPPTSLSCYFGAQGSKSGIRPTTKALHLGFYTLMAAWHIGETYLPPPEHKPDLWVVLNIIIGAAGFGVCYFWTTWQLILRSNVMEEWLGYRATQDGLKKEERAKALPLDWYWRKRENGNAELQEGEKKSGGKKKKESPMEKRERRTSTKSLSPTPEPNAARRSPRKRKVTPSG